MADTLPIVVALVGCGKKKRLVSGKVQAKNLYTGVPFQLALSHAYRTADDVHIVSAYHGLIAPYEEIETYDLCMVQLPKSAQEEWGHNIVATLQELYLLTPLHIVFYAGMQYIRPILHAIGPELGYWTYENPLEGMDLFARIKWFKSHQMDAPTIP